MKLILVGSFVMAFHISLIDSHNPTLKEWTRLKIEGREEVAEKVFLIFTPNIKTVAYLTLKELPLLVEDPAFDKSRPTVMYFHGWLESGELDLSVTAIRGAYNDRGDHNVLSVDWSYYSKNFFYNLNVIPQMVIIAEEFAERLNEFLDNGYNVDDLHLVGHSLGGQMVGKVGRQLQKITSGRLVIPRIYALDPAGPGFENRHNSNFEPITRDDAKHVQIIHTNGGQLGMLHRVGTIDFYPNGGTKHPGCGVDVTASFIEAYQHMCDHARSWHFFQKSVTNPEAFPAIRCNGWDDFVEGTCFEGDIVHMGFGANTSETGKYYLQTRGNMFNLSRGKVGTVFTNHTFARLPINIIDDRDLTIPKEVHGMVVF